MRHSTGKPTEAEQARFDRMKELGICVACYQRGWRGGQYVEIHHLLSGNRRIGHMATVSLCGWHHRKKSSHEGGTASQDQRRRHRNKFKVSEPHPGRIA